MSMRPSNSRNPEGEGTEGGFRRVGPHLTSWSPLQWPRLPLSFRTPPPSLGIPSLPPSFASFLPSFFSLSISISILILISISFFLFAED